MAGQTRAAREGACGGHGKAGPRQRGLLGEAGRALQGQEQDGGPWGRARKGGSGSRARGRAASLRARRAVVTAALLPPVPCSGPAVAPPADPSQAGAALPCR